MQKEDQKRVALHETVKGMCPPIELGHIDGGPEDDVRVDEPSTWPRDCWVYGLMGVVPNASGARRVRCWGSGTHSVRRDWHTVAAARACAHGAGHPSWQHGRRV